jgi:hypothetical protein
VSERDSLSVVSLGGVGRDRIDHVVSICEPFQRVVPAGPQLDRGVICAAAPPGASFRNPTDLEHGVVGSFVATADDWLDRKLMDVGCRSSNSTVIAVDPIARPHFDALDLTNHGFVRKAYKECVFYAKAGSTWKRGDADELRRAIISFDYFGLVVDSDFADCDLNLWADEKSTTHAVRFLFVTAFDQEGFVYWSRDDENCL